MKTKHLGKNNKKPLSGYKILDPILRNINGLSYGHDIWNAYEFSFLDSNKQSRNNNYQNKKFIICKFYLIEY